MISFSKAANACGVQSAGESMDEVTIALSCRDESAKSQNGRTHYDDISYHFIIGGRTVKDPQSRTASGNTATGFKPSLTTPPATATRLSVIVRCPSTLLAIRTLLSIPARSVSTLPVPKMLR
jgi:hypothetical protein